MLYVFTPGFPAENSSDHATAINDFAGVVSTINQSV